MAPLPATITDLPFGTVAMGLFGGLALFIFGMGQMTDALKLVAGTRMRALLGRLATNRFRALFAGAFVTSIIQSSSVTTVLVVGFVSASLMTLTQSIGVILGAGIGTTVTAQIVAFKVTQFALVPVTIGFAMLFAGRREAIRHWGHMVMGLGLVFFGMHLMGEAARPLRDYEPFIELMREIEKPGWAILAAALFTAIIQSSSATVGVIIALASQGLVSLETGIALAFGANIGTCVTAMLASIGRSREAARVALAHVVFKVVGVLIWIGLIAQLASAVRWLSPTHPELEGAARLAAETPRQIANAHTLFNVANALLFIGFVGPFARLMRLVVPEKPEEALAGARPRYLDDLLLRTPDLALDRVRLELERLGACAHRMVLAAPGAVLRGTEVDLARLREMDNDVDMLHRAIIAYLGRLARRDLSDEQSREAGRYLAAATYMENIGDVVETNIVELGHDRLRHDFVISPQTRDVVRGFFEKTTWAVDRSIAAFVSADEGAAREVIDAKPQITSLANEAEDHLARRLTAGEPDRLVAFRIETDLIEAIKRIYYFAKRIAKLIVEEETAPSIAPAPPPDGG